MSAETIIGSSLDDCRYHTTKYLFDKKKITAFVQIGQYTFYKMANINPGYDIAPGIQSVNYSRRGITRYYPTPLYEYNIHQNTIGAKDIFNRLLPNRIKWISVEC